MAGMLGAGVTCLGRHLRVDPITGCFVWVGSRTRQGYGHVRARRADGSWTVRKVHREVARRCWGDAAIAGLDVDHRCRNRSCANPRHLRPLVAAQNRGWV